MGKEIIIIFVILIIIFGANFGVTRYLEKSSNELIELIEKINSSLSYNNDVSELVKELNGKWKEISEVWATLILHEELDKIELAIINAKIAIEEDNENDAKVELGELVFLCEHIVEKEKFSLKNVL